MKTETKLGTPPPPGAQPDAIHIAVYPAVANGNLYPGQFVRIVNNTAFTAEPSNAHGVIDPFINHEVKSNQQVWILLKPGSITSLRHVWTHPEITGDCPVVVDGAKLDSEKWLRSYIADQDGRYDQAMADAKECALHGGMNHDPCFYLTLTPEFWHHFEVVTGIKPIDPELVKFSCAC